jgi:iron only hydrogenase large subunit-like protein
MSAILSASDLNDFIAPGVACIKPIEPLSTHHKDTSANPYEVTTEDKLAAANPQPAQISLTDCLACSGCVTSAEAMLVSLQSHGEVLDTLDKWRSWDGPREGYTNGVNGGTNGHTTEESRIFVATISPQVRASIAATYGISIREASNMISQLLSGPDGLASGGNHGSHFTWILDTNIFREIALVAAAEEVAQLLEDPTRTVKGDGSALTDKPKKPILTSACPGWICYAEKTHPHVLPHLSRLKSPQALAGTLLKSVLAKKYGVDPSRVWHLAIMPCFDKKLEASRSELTSAVWSGSETEPIRDVDCVITARELISLASARGMDFGTLSRSPVPRIPFPDSRINAFLFPHSRRKDADIAAGTSGGYLYHILRRLQAEHTDSQIQINRGRNADVVEYILLSSTGQNIVKLARYYGFRNIQNLVRKLKPARTSRLLAAAGAKARPAGLKTPAASEVDFSYVEVMACPGGCTNGGGQIRAGEVTSLRNGEGLPDELERIGPAETKAWLGQVDEAYYSGEGGSEEEMDIDSVGTNGHSNGYTNGNGTTGHTNGTSAPEDLIDGISRSHILGIVEHWSNVTGVSAQDLVGTSYRKVISDVGKKVSDVERVAGLASSLGGGW